VEQVLETSEKYWKRQNKSWKC